MSKKILFFILTTVGLPILVQAADTTPLNAGFVGSIWYSSNKIAPDDRIRVYSAIQNQTNFDIIGTIELYDNGELSGTTNFSLVKGSLAQSWIDWAAKSGKHQLYEKIINTKKWEVGKDPVAITIQNSESNTDLPTIAEPILDNATSSTPPSVTQTTLTPPTNNNTPIPEGVNSAFSTTSTTSATSSSTLATTATNTAEAIGEKIAGAWNATGHNFYDTTINNLSNMLIQKQIELEQQIAASSSPPLLQKQLQDLDKNSPYLKIPSEKAPTVNHVYKWVIGAALFTLNTWWLMTILLLLAARTIFRLFARLWRRHHRDDE